AKARDVTVVRGRASFENSNTLRVESDEGQQYIEYDHAILAVGSHPAVPSAWDLGNPRIMTSTEALEIEDIPETLLIVGGGYIGMELGTVYAGLGSKIVMVEALDSILMGADADLKRPVLKRAESMFESVRLKTKVESMSTSGKQIKVAMTFGDERVEELYDRVLIAVGRRPNTEDLGLDATKIALDERGYVKVNDQQRTDDESIYAIGDVAGGILLAHKASKEARIAIDAIFGEEPGTRDYIIPAVVFTDPEIAWCGVTESEAKEKGLNVEVSRFPWSGSGRALSFDRTEGLTKLVIDKDTERILGVGIVGVGAGELIGEGVLAVEMGATALDLAETVHAHPTVAETLMESAELFYGHATHRIGRKARS
ncbi:MAG: NAD(P)/FAD-dependent oxidoreductase, partial [Candidatus Poribacteria bacterium]|nr:NAD(P)/FAD-dependent oxidoreductase [Candidatus Poribacteria bacterium]